MGTCKDHSRVSGVREGLVFLFVAIPKATGNGGQRVLPAAAASRFLLEDLSLNDNARSRQPFLWRGNPSGMERPLRIIPQKPLALSFAKHLLTNHRAYSIRVSQCGHSSVGRVSASQAECRGFESRCPLTNYFGKLNRTRMREETKWARAHFFISQKQIWNS